MFRRLELLCLASLLGAVVPGCVSWSDDAAFACKLDSDCPRGSCVNETCGTVSTPAGCTPASCEGLCGVVEDGCGGTQSCFCPGGPSDCVVTAGSESGLCCHPSECEGLCNAVPDGCGNEQLCECNPGLVCSDAAPTPGTCCTPLPLDCASAAECAVLRDDCMAVEVTCGCREPGNRCAGSPAACEPCNCPQGQVCLLDGTCVPTSGPRCYGALKEVREINNFEPNAGLVRNEKFPSLAFASKEGSTWLYFLTARWQTENFYWPEFAEVRLASSLSAEAATLAPIPLDSGGFKYHVSAAPDGSELFLSSGDPGEFGWNWVRVFHTLPLQGGGWSVPGRIPDLGVRDSNPVNATLLPDRRTVLYVDVRNPFAPKTARRSTTAPSDVAFEDLGPVALDPATRWWPNGPSCDGQGLFYVADNSLDPVVDLQPRYAPILSYDPLTFGPPELLSVPGLPTVRAGIALAETPDCAALWIWIDGHLKAAPRIPCP